jgi:hypothetical protein
MALVILALGPLYLGMRLLGHFPKRDVNAKIKPTVSGKIYHSKVDDAAFFDGESEDYVEALNRMRQYGGA